MLETARAEVLLHVTKFNVNYRTDSSNLSSDYARNKVRNQIVPLLRELNPEFDEAVARLAGLIREDSSLLDFEAQEALKAMAKPMEVKRIGGLHPAIRRRLVRMWIVEARGDLLRIDEAHLDAIDDLIERRRGNKMVELPDGWRVSLKNGLLTIFQASVVQEA